MAVQEIICTLFKLGATCYSMPIDELLIEYLLVPSVILIIFLYIMTGSFLKGIGLKIHALLAIVFYIVLIYTGIYGMIASFSMSYLSLFLLFGLAYFFFIRLIDWKKMRSISRYAGYFGERKYNLKYIDEEIALKEEEIKRLKKQKKDLERIKDEYADKGLAPEGEFFTAYQGVQAAITQAELEKKRLLERKKELEKSLGVGYISRRSFVKK
ncbi:MAG: hypothetical protein J7J15_02845 [Candidatus Aenigmarchaeota archaeon]|nr:hypothetical protein [Candidatus Aenigmarchaeota archaeon]